MRDVKVLDMGFLLGHKQKGVSAAAPRHQHDGLLSLSVTTKENIANMKVRICMNRVPSEMVFQLWHPHTGTPMHDEHVVAVAS